MSENRISDKEKIEILERFLRAVVGCHNPEAPIRYRKICDTYEVLLECNPDTIVKYLPELGLNDIDVMFYSALKKENGETVPIVEVEIMFEPQYWRDVLRLEKENKELKKEIRKLKKEMKKNDNEKTKDQS